MSRAGFVRPCDGKILKGPLGEVISNSCAACDLITGISLVGTSQVVLFSNDIEHDMVMSLIRSRAMQVSSDKGNKTRLSRFKRRKIFVERTGVTWPSRSLCRSLVRECPDHVWSVPEPWGITLKGFMMLRECL